jgi:uncharacterized protein YkuJ
MPHNDYTFDDFKIDVYAFNEIAGKDKAASHLDLCKQFKLVVEELKELSDGLNENNPVEVLDGVVDVLITSLGLLQKLEALGFNAQKALFDTAENNLSKYPTDEAVAIETAKTFESEGIAVNVTYNTAYDMFVIKDLQDKVRKPFNFKSNDLSSCVPMYVLCNGFEGYPKHGN